MSQTIFIHYVKKYQFNGDKSRKTVLFFLHSYFPSIEVGRVAVHSN